MMGSNADFEDKIASSENGSFKNLAVCINSKELAQAIEKYEVHLPRFAAGRVVTVFLGPGHGGWIYEQLDVQEGGHVLHQQETL